MKMEVDLIKKAYVLKLPCGGPNGESYWKKATKKTYAFKDAEEAKTSLKDALDAICPCLKDLCGWPCVNSKQTGQQGLLQV